MRRNESGSALVMTIIVLMIFSILGASVAFIGATEIRMADRHNKRLQAFYNAVSGREVVTEKIRALIDSGKYYDLVDYVENDLFRFHFGFSLEDVTINLVAGVPDGSTSKNTVVAGDLKHPVNPEPSLNRALWTSTGSSASFGSSVHQELFRDLFWPPKPTEEEDPDFVFGDVL